MCYFFFRSYIYPLDLHVLTHSFPTRLSSERGGWEGFGEGGQADYGEGVDWVTQQAFCDGRIGVYGVSYLGITAIITAAQNHPAVKAAFPIVPIGDGYRDIVFTGGQVNPTFIPFWLMFVSALGVTNPTILTDPRSEEQRLNSSH